MLSHCDLVAFVAVRDAERAKRFYRDLLGLPLIGEDSFALVFDAHGTTLRVSIVPELAPAKHTVLGWTVSDVASAVRELNAEGVTVVRYPFLAQDDAGIWTAPSGSRVAWFEDPDGNLLSLTQNPG